MRVNFLQLLVFCCCLSVQAQKMVTRTAEWKYVSESFDVPTIPWYIAGFYEARYKEIV